MKAYLIVPANFDEPSGSPVHAKEVAKALVELGCDLTLFVNHSSQSDLDYVRTIGCDSGILHIVPWQFLATYKLIKEIFLSGKPDAMYLRYSTLAATPAFVASVLSIPLLVDMHICSGVELKARPRYKYFKHLMFLAHLVEYFVYRRAKHIIVVSDTIRRYIKARFHIPDKKITVVENGVDIKEYKPMSREECRAKLGIPNESKCVVYAGNASPWQGLHTLSSAIPLVTEQCGKVIFIFVGISRDDINVPEEILPFCRFTGWVDSSDVVCYIGASDLCVAPYNSFVKTKGGNSLKLLTYMACARPVVATDVGDISRCVVQANAGILVEPDNSQKLAHEICEMLQDKYDCERMGQNGRRYVKVHHTWTNVAQTILDTMQSMHTGYPIIGNEL